MSTGEGGDINEVRARLDEGIDELGAAYTPLETGRANAAIILERTAQMEVSLGALMSFFGTMGERVRDEVATPYGSAAERYKKAAELIVASVTGSDNEDAQSAGQGATTMSERADALVKATKNISQSDHGSLGAILAKLNEANVLVKQFATEVAGAIDDAYGIQTANHGPTMEAAENYLDTLS